VHAAAVTVEGRTVGEIGRGLLAFVGVAEGDGPADLDYVASKIQGLRIFADDAGRMNRSVGDVSGAVLLVSQFTLFGDVRRGRRPAFDGAAPPAFAREMYEALATRLAAMGTPVATGVFQADMQVSLVNDGPVTILIDSRRLF
jgi:D-tyrosyl-tRNA(Tyr) deacylase